MSKYQKTDTTEVKSEWQRCDGITMTRPLNGAPTVVFSEEKVTQFGDREFREPTGGIGIQVTDMSKKFDIYNPITQEKTGGQMSYQDLYILLYSIYLTKAIERDSTQV